MDNCKFPGISQFNSTKSDYGISMDQKSCWEATEDHFMCLDKFNDVYGNFATASLSFLFQKHD